MWRNYFYGSLVVVGICLELALFFFGWRPMCEALFPGPKHVLTDSKSEVTFREVGHTWVVVAKGDEVIKAMNIDNESFVFVISPEGVGYKDTSSIDPVWYCSIVDLRALGEGHRRIVWEYATKGLK